MNYLTRHDLVENLGISLSSVDKLLKRSDHPIPHVKLGKVIRIAPDWLDKWIKEELNAGKASKEE